jgi:FeS assembly SUF system protein
LDLNNLDNRVARSVPEILRRLSGLFKVSEHNGQMEVAMEGTIIEAEVIEALRSCFDPEIPVNIYELGLIYDVKVDPSGAVGIRMTLTSPSCPAAQSLPAEVQAKARDVRGVTDVTVDVVWDPPWDPSKMSEAAKLQLGFM